MKKAGGESEKKLGERVKKAGGESEKSWGRKAGGDKLEAGEKSRKLEEEIGRGAKRENCTKNLGT